MLRKIALTAAVAAVIALLLFLVLRSPDSEFLSRLVDTLAWPLTLLAIVFLLRREIASLFGPLAEALGRLEKLSTKSVTAEFGKAAKDAEDELGKGEQRPPEDQLPEKPAAKEIYLPATEVLEAWLQVEQLCRELLAARGFSVPGPYRALGSRLKRYNLIDEHHARVLDTLRQMRNMVVHGGAGAIGPREASEFIALADRMAFYLSNQLKQDSNGNGRADEESPRHDT